MVADTFMMLKLFGKDGEFDHRKIMSFDSKCPGMGQ